MKSLLPATLLAVLAAAAAAQTAAQTAPLTLKLTTDTVEGVAARADMTPAALAQQPVTIHLAITGGNVPQVNATLTAEDIFGQPIAWKFSQPIVLTNGSFADIPFTPPGPGYFRIHGEFKTPVQTFTASTDFGVIPSPHPGLRPESFFASNTSNFKRGADLDLLQAIGMKIDRLQWYPKMLKDPAAMPPGQPPPMDFTAIDKEMANIKAHDQWVLPILCYSLPGDNLPLAIDLGMHGPPRDIPRFAATWAEIMKHNPEITTLEFWNEPWIFGWTWAGTPATYRDMQTQLAQALLKVNPKYRILAASSTTFAIDNFEPEPASWRGLISGIAQHPYTQSVAAPNMRGGDLFRFVDETPLLAKRMKLPYAYLTEGGTWYSTTQAKIDALNAQMAAMSPQEKASPQGMELQARLTSMNRDQEQFNNLENARKIVQYFVMTAIDGLYQGDAQWQIGYGAGWTRGNTTFAVMTHFLEDRPIVADIWPTNELLWGGIFANPRFVTPQVKALPRASELSARWTVPIPADRATDKTKVAVVWNQTGKSNTQIDTHGTITLSASPDLKAFDMTGRPIPAVDGNLVLPFTPSPIYITSDALSVVDLREQIAEAQIREVTPVNMYALSLRDAAAKPQSLSVRVENQLNVPVAGILRMKLKGWPGEATQPFSIPPSRLAEVQIPWPGAPTDSPNNQYSIQLTAEISGSHGMSPMEVMHDQLIAAAAFVKKTVPIDGSLDGWKELTPVLLDSDLLATDTSIAQYLANPGLEKPTGTPGKKRIVARVYTAYDDDNVYLAAAVNEDKYENHAGDPVIKGRKATKVALPYKTGTLGGLNYPLFTGNAFEFAFGFRDRVPGEGRQMNDPYAWKGLIYDTDYNYVAHGSTEGDQLIRLWGPDTSRRNGYQTELVPGQGSVPGAKVKIVRDETRKLTIYQLAIPRTELALFKPASGRLRFSFILYNSEGVGTGGALSWSDAAGVFDYWRTVGSFAPTWNQHTAAQSFFGIR